MKRAPQHFNPDAWRIALGQESRYYPDHVEYCRARRIPTSAWVRKHNHIKTAH